MHGTGRFLPGTPPHFPHNGGKQDNRQASCGEPPKLKNKGRNVTERSSKERLHFTIVPFGEGRHHSQIVTKPRVDVTQLGPQPKAKARHIRDSRPKEAESQAIPQDREKTEGVEGVVDKERERPDAREPVSKDLEEELAKKVVEAQPGKANGFLERKLHCTSAERVVAARV
jgi:hypothetical protein